MNNDSIAGVSGEAVKAAVTLLMDCSKDLGVELRVCWSCEIEDADERE